MFFEFIEDLTRVGGEYILKRPGLPLFNCCKVIPEIIREYEHLVLGSQLAIKISFFLKDHGIEVGPEEVAREIFSSLNSTPSRKYFLGRDVYLNAEINLNEVISEISAIQSGDIFISNSKIIPEVANSILGDDKLKELYFGSLENFLNQNSFKSDTKDLSSRDQKLVYLSYLADPEFDETHFIKGLSSRDNPIWQWNIFNSIINDYFSSRESDAHDRGDAERIKGSINTVPATHRQLINLKESTSVALSLYDYYLFDSLKREKPELFWIHMINLQRKVTAFWNDPWGRLAILNMSKKGDNGELDYIFRGLLVIRDSLHNLIN